MPAKRFIAQLLYAAPGNWTCMIMAWPFVCRTRSLVQSTYLEVEGGDAGVDVVGRKTQRVVVVPQRALFQKGGYITQAGVETGRSLTVTLFIVNPLWKTAGYSVYLAACRVARSHPPTSRLFGYRYSLH
jgi:hypothetical protein